MNSTDRVWRERSLGAAVLSGDERAWRVWYEESFAGLYAYVLRRCAGLREHAEEVVQETWLVAVRRVAAFDPVQAAFATWLRGIATHVLRNHFRRAKHRGRCVSLNGVDAAARSDSEQRERAERVASVLSQLPERYEAVLRAKYLDGLSVAEVAADWNETPKTIESLLTRAVRLSARRIMKSTDLQPDPPDRDLCDELLTPSALPGDLTVLREQLLQRTTRWIRWRRRLRRIGYVAALAACWIGGMLTMHWLSPAPAQVIVETRSASIESAPPPPPRTPALVKEWQAIDSDKDQAKLYRVAAEVYLNEEHDPLSAVRCYGCALDTEPAQVKTISKDDDWLLMAIKDARKKEKTDAKSVD